MKLEDFFYSMPIEAFGALFAMLIFILVGIVSFGPLLITALKKRFK